MIRERFIGLHILAILLHLLCVVYAFSLRISYEYPLKLSYSIFNFPYKNASTPYYVLIENNELSFPSVLIVHGIIALVTFIFHTFIYLPSHIYYATTIWRQKFFTWRWIEYSITCTLMTVASNLSSGNYDFNNFILTMSSGITLQMFGMLIERKKRLWKPLLGFAAILEFGLGWGVFWNTLTSKNNSHAWIEFIAYGFYYSLFPINCVRDAVLRNNFVQTDYIYNVLSLTSKLALFWMQVGELERNIHYSIWTDIEIYVLGIVLPLILLVTGILTSPKQVNFPEKKSSNTLLKRLVKFYFFP